MLKIKNKSNEYLDSISLKEANDNIYFEDIEFAMNGKGNQKFSIGTKKLVVFLVGVFIPISMIISLITDRVKVGNFLPQTILAVFLELLIVSFMVYQFYKSSRTVLKYWEYEEVSYTIVKSAYISLFVMGYGMDEGNYIVPFLVVTTCILVFLFFYFKVEENMVVEEINKIFNREYKTSKTMSIMIKISGVVAFLILIAMQFYRLNKWWIQDSIVNDSTNQTSLIDDLTGIFLGIPILLLITLIPTYFLFKPKSYVKTKIIKKYAEEFRERYDYTKKQWYGE
ncbi:hypothetical protein BCR26_04420 [Enterococcus rivorum]|uniref:Uncharacterized protein n=2 Tax=Enterococcus rivorum TaxID=762845 RepID=A0A1E5KUK0_9ENTE|nr:hypothetical protein BCR26_04420 [Enterococcus rivorum]